MWWPGGRGGGLLLVAATPWWWQCAVGGGASESRVMLNYFFTIKSHIIDLFLVGRVMQYRLEMVLSHCWWVWCLLGLVMPVASWWWWPIGTCGGLMGIGVASCYRRRPLGGGSELLVVVLVNRARVC